ncbi:TPA: aromatic ring-hydroxylating dioxygenase subunit alpha, partial [Pseudomonas aeruginosa]|nr:aromatic ring-hydroxylating dioxygenase subunit alpha [Pseudomonas aeruginosa]
VLAEADEDSYEISVASDAPAVATRTYLKRRADEEARQRAAHRVA